MKEQVTLVPYFKLNIKSILINQKPIRYQPISQTPIQSRIRTAKGTESIARIVKITGIIEASTIDRIMKEEIEVTVVIDHAEAEVEA